MQVGKTSTLKVIITPTNATNKKLTYLSANTKIATVDKNGNIKGIITGKTVITVTSSSNKKAVAKCNVTVSQVDRNINLAVKVGDYVEFGSYYGESILWKVMEINNGKPLLWSEYILTAKCFDAAESGTVYEGSSDAEKLGSNVWSNSNLREWLNTTGMVNWSTQPPTAGATWGSISYDAENGFLTGFLQAERNKIAKTTRKVMDSDGNYKETTQDLVFLANYDEVKDGGSWTLNDNSRIKKPTAQAANNDRNGYMKEGENYHYYLDSPYAVRSWYVRIVAEDGFILDYYDYCAWNHGVAPALQLSSYLPIEGAGTKDKPWKF